MNVGYSEELGEGELKTKRLNPSYGMTSIASCLQADIYGEEGGRRLVSLSSQSAGW